MSDIIDDLSAALKPRPRLSNYLRRFTVWLIISLLSLVGILAIFGYRPDLSTQLTSFTFWGELASSIGICILAALASFRLSIPQRDLPWIRYALGIPLVLWIFFLGIKFFHFLSNGQHLDFFAHYKCMYIIYTMAFFPTLLILWMFKKAFPINAFYSGLFACVASGAIALIGIKIVCPLETFWHVLLWHIGPFFSLGVLGSLVGKRLFKTP